MILTVVRALSGITRRAALSVLILMSALSHEAFAEEVSSQHRHLWKIEKNGVHFYVLGSLHNVAASAISPEVREIIQKAPQVLIESRLDQLERFLLFRGQLYQKAGQSLKTVLSEKAWRSFLELTNGVYSEKELEAMSPMKAALEIKAFRSAKNKGGEFDRLRAAVNAHHGAMDLEFFVQAQKSGKRVGTVDSLDAIADLFNHSAAEVEELLSMSDAEFARRELEVLNSDAALVDGYMKGRIVELKGEIQKSPESKRRGMYVDRNRDWIPKIENEIYKVLGPSVVIVGGSHLYGREGLLALFKARGFTVSPFRSRVCHALFQAN